MKQSSGFISITRTLHQGNQQSSTGMPNLKKVLFHQYNAPCHKIMEMMVKLNELRFKLLPRLTLFSGSFETISLRVKFPHFWLHNFGLLMSILHEKNFNRTPTYVPDTPLLCILNFVGETKKSRSPRSSIITAKTPTLRLCYTKTTQAAGWPHGFSCFTVSFPITFADFKQMVSMSLQCNVRLISRMCSIEPIEV